MVRNVAWKSPAITLSHRDKFLNCGVSHMKFRLWERLEGRERGVKPDPMVSTNACRELAEKASEQLRRRLASEKGK